MPNPVITGTPLPVRKPDVVRFDPTRGVVRDLSWEAAIPTTLNPVASLLLASRMSYNLSGELPARIVASASGSDLGQPEITTDNWQILANELQRHIFQGQVALQLEQNVPGALSQVESNYTLVSTPGTTPRMTPSTITWDDPSVSGNDLSASIGLLSLLMRGATHTPESQYVVKHTVNISQNFTTNIADAHVGQIYTTAQLLTEITDGSLWTYPLPPRLVTKINAIETPAARTNYTIGWRKLAATETTSAENRIEISTEYWFGQWFTATVYGLPFAYRVYA